MSRPWVIWIVLVGCALLIVGAMGWLSQRIIGMEEERNRVAAEAELEERVRLALARMDAAASSFLIIENQRPPAHFESFYAPDDILTNAYQNVGKTLVRRPSPLLERPSEFVRLHFELRPGVGLSSPQVPVGNERDLAEASGISRDFLNRAAGDLNVLRELLGNTPEGPDTDDRILRTNFEMLSLVCGPTQLAWNWNGLEQKAVEEKSEWVAQQRQRGGNVIRQLPDYQQELSYVEQGKRAQVLEEAQAEAARYAVQKRDWNVQDAPNPAVARRDAAEEAPNAGAGADANQAGAAAPQASATQAEEQADADPFSEPPVVQAEVAVSEATPFRPVWLGSELFAVRRISDEEGVRLQGIWLQVAALKSKLLATSTDLLPQAALTPVKTLIADNLEGLLDVGLTELEFEPRALVTLPWRLEVGEAAVVSPLAWTPLRVSLVTGWAAVILAMIAAAALLRGVLKMSERRAAFVSSVTHELRTPLTTFQLYSDLLAGGMVKEEEKRQGYLDTLCLEAGRLNHLIENVLAYSRIERGSARAKHEVLPVASLVDRFERRVRERVEQEEGNFEVRKDDSCDEVEVDTDVTAVEQIVFNLVDNACKYGMGEEGRGAICLRAEVKGRKARLAVCDEGCGIDRKDLKKLFRPFHKSAKEAAHSKPGVGLGLALSRRLARALGGDLKVEPNNGKGACFVLELPVKR